MTDFVQNLRDTRKMILDAGGKAIKAAGGNIFYTDRVVIGAVNRSLALLDGFLKLHEAKNFLCMAPMVRMHLDTLLRLHAAFNMVPSIEVFAEAVLEGQNIDRFKGADGKELKDAVVKRAFVDFWSSQGHDVAWVDPVYKATSGHIHLSAAHAESAVKFGKAPDEIVVRIDGSICDDVAYSDLAKKAFGAMTEISYGICAYLEQWARTKEEWVRLKDSRSIGVDGRDKPGHDNLGERGE